MNKLVIIGIVVIAIIGFSALTYAGYVPGLSELFQSNPDEMKQLIKVYSEAMEPAIKSGATISYKTVDFDSLEVGDIIVIQFSADSAIFISRISEITSEGLKTKADNNPGPDSWTVTPDYLIGKVVTINNP